jgi:hypothetical protein
MAASVAIAFVRLPDWKHAAPAVLCGLIQHSARIVAGVF